MEERVRQMLEIDKHYIIEDKKTKKRQVIQITSVKVNNKDYLLFMEIGAELPMYYGEAKEKQLLNDFTILCEIDLDNLVLKNVNEQAPNKVDSLDRLLSVERLLVCINKAALVSLSAMLEEFQKKIVLACGVRLDTPVESSNPDASAEKENKEWQQP